MEALGINQGFFLAQFINFAIFVVITWQGWKALVKVLDERAAKIAKGVEDARVAAEARSNAEAEAQKILADARSEAQKVVAEARASAEERARPILQAAQEEADKIRSDAQTRAKEAQESALSGVRGQVVSLAMAAANKLIGASMDAKQQEKMVNDFFATSTVDLKGIGAGAVVTTALPLSDPEKKSIESQLGGAVSEWAVDPSILGGVVVRAGDKVVDGSVRTKMAGLSASLN